MSQGKPLKKLLDRETEKPVLERLYCQFAIPSDKLRGYPAVLRAIVSAFNTICGCNYDEELLLRYIFNRRKETDWPRLGAASKGKLVPSVGLDADELATLETIYCEFDKTSDDLLFSAPSLRNLSKRFREETGRAIPGSVLAYEILAKRKRGDWTKIRTEGAQTPFADIEEVERKRKRAT